MITKTVTIGDVAEILSGFAFKSSYFSKERCHMPLIRIRDILRGETDTFYSGEYDKEYVIYSGDLLISMDGEFYLAPWKGPDAVLNQRVCKISPKNEQVIGEYLKYFLPKKLKEIENITPFVTVKHLSVKKIREIEIPLPSLSEQKRIVSLLGQADALRQKRKESMQLMDEYVESTFMNMFGTPSRNIYAFPVGAIGDLVSEVKYGTSKKAEVGGQYIYLRMNNITYGGELDLSNLKYINLTKMDEEKYLTHKGDILFNRTNSKELVGKTAVCNLDTPMAIAGYLIRIRTNEFAIPEYISGYLNSKHGKTTLENMCKSIIGMANINAKELQKIKINIPPLSIQKKYADSVQKIYELKKNMSVQLRELDNQFNSLMQQAFSGAL